MRSRQDLLDYRRDLGHTDDAELCAMLDALLRGNESARAAVESALDQVDADAARYEMTD